MDRHKSEKRYYTFLGDECGPSDFYYHLPRQGYHRRLHTKPANRAAEAVASDPDLRDYGIFVRGARRKLPTSWDDLNVSRVQCKCWKDFTKKRKQWED